MNSSYIIHEQFRPSALFDVCIVQLFTNNGGLVSLSAALERRDGGELFRIYNGLSNNSFCHSSVCVYSLLISQSPIDILHSAAYDSSLVTLHRARIVLVINHHS